MRIPILILGFKGLKNQLIYSKFNQVVEWILLANLVNSVTYFALTTMIWAETASRLQKSS